jgi:hypothetical protein
MWPLEVLIVGRISTTLFICGETAPTVKNDLVQNDDNATETKIN